MADIVGAGGLADVLEIAEEHGIRVHSAAIPRCVTGTGSWFERQNALAKEISSRHGITVVVAANGTLQFPIDIRPPGENPTDFRPVLTTVWQRRRKG